MSERLHYELYTMLWKYPYNWLGSMAAINSCPPLSGLNDLVRGHTSPDALYEINTTSPSKLNRPSVPFASRVWCCWCRPPPPPPSHSESFWRGAIFHHPKQNCRTAALQRERPKLLFNLFSSLVYVKPALNVSTVFACQCGSVCSSLFSDVDSLIACKFSSLC